MTRKSSRQHFGRTRVAMGALGFGVLILHLSAARAANINFVRPTDLPSLGLRLKLMPDAREAPSPPPTVYRYTVSAGDKSWKEELYAPCELWRHEQMAGRWTDAQGNTLSAASITRLLPTHFEREHVTRENYNRKASGTALAPQAWTGADITRWMTDFLGMECAVPRVVERHSLNLLNLLRFDIDSQPRRLAYVLQLNPRAAGQSRAPAGWFLLMVDPAPGTPLDRAISAIEDKLLPSITVSRAVPPASVRRSSPARLGHAGKDTPSQEFLASRRQVTDSIRNMQDWWYVETENYIILSDLTSRHRVTVSQLQERIEVLRAAYLAYLPPRQAIDAISVIRVFATPQEYESYVGPEMRWTGGVWMPSRKELVIKPPDDRQTRLRDLLFRVTYHEAFHQYMFYAMDQLDTSVWFNEGHAVFFENAEPQRNQLKIAEDEQRVVVLQEMMRAGLVDLDELLALSREEFYADNDEQRKRNYTLAWALVYYLRKGTVVDGSPDAYRNILPAYLDVLCQTEEPVRATAAAFEGVDRASFRKDFLAFWSSRNLRSAARRKTP